MRIGLIVDGQSEVEAFPLLHAQLRESTGHTFVGPVRANIHPNARDTAISSGVAGRIEYLLVREVDEVVFLIDREDRSECPGQIADQLREQIQPRIPIPIRVVVKDHMFEDWLVADIDALRAMRARFTVADAIARSISPNRADSVNAYEALKSCAQRRSYHKVRDAQLILKHAEVLRMAANSRSFRRFLRCVGHPTYTTQSRDPA